MESHLVAPENVRDRHLFVRYHGTGSLADHDLVDENGRVVVDGSVDPATLGPCGYSNFNHIDWLVTGILEERGIIQG